MLHRLPNGQLAVETLDSFDGDTVKTISSVQEWTDGFYDPEKSLKEQRKQEKLEALKKAKILKMKKESDAAKAKIKALEMKASHALMKKEMASGQNQTQKVLAEYHLKNQAMGDTKADYGPTYDLEQMSAKSAFNVTPIKGEHYGHQEYYIQDYNYQNSPDRQTLKNRFADNVKFKSPVAIKSPDFIDAYVEGSELENTEYALAVQQEQQFNEFNYTEDSVLTEGETIGPGDQKSNKALIAILLALAAYMIGG